MKTAYGRLAVLAAFALAGVAVLVPAAPAIPVEPAAPAEPRAADPDEEREVPQSVFAGTAIGAVLEANGNEVPKNGEQMMKVLEKFGEVGHRWSIEDGARTRKRCDRHPGLDPGSAFFLLEASRRQADPGSGPE